MRRQVVIAALVGAASVAVVWACVELRRRAREEAEIRRVVEMVRRFKQGGADDENRDTADTQVMPSGGSRLTTGLEKSRLASEYYEKFNAAKDVVENPGVHTLKELGDAAASLSDLEATGDMYDASHAATIKGWRARLGRILVDRYRYEATTFAALPTTTPHDGLAKYAEAEDYVRKSLLDAKKAKNKADEESYTATYKALLAESDAYAYRVITPEFIDAVPWKDLLSGEMATRWSKTTTVPGFTCRIDDGVLTMTLSDPGSKQQGVIGIFDQKYDDLRHFRLEMEFAVEGVVTMFFHVSPAPQNPDNRQSHAYDLVAGKDALVPGRTYRLVATYVGSDLVFEFPDSRVGDAIATWRADPSWVKLRRGGIAFLVPEGGRLTVTRMRIKELR